jgi:hypothetical protein
MTPSTCFCDIEGARGEVTYSQQPRDAISILM